jgi:hypothetical protein
VQKKGQVNPVPVAKQNGQMKGNAGSCNSSSSSGQALNTEGAQGPFPSEGKPVQNGSSAFVEDQHKGSKQPAGPEAAERRKKSE